MIITLCRRGLLKIYASFCELNISFCVALTFRFADYKTQKELTFRERRFPCNVKGPVDRTWFCDGTFYGFIVFSNFPFLKSSLSFYFPASSLVAFMMTSRWLPGLRTIFLRKSPIALPSTLLTVFT